MTKFRSPLRALATCLLIAAACGESPTSTEDGPITAGSAAGGATAGAGGSVAAGASATGGSAGANASASGAGGSGGGAPAAGAGAAGASGGSGASGAGSAGEAGTGGAGQAGAAAGAGGQAGSGTAGSDGGSGSLDPSCEGDDQADFALVGWAAQNGGTTGGKGGRTVNVSDGAALVQALSEQQDSSSPLTIVVSGRITTANSGGVEKIDVKDVRDVSILGAGSGAEFDGIGLKIVRAGNIVIRNLRIHHVQTGDKDAIGIEGPADHIWIDHCELFNRYEGVDKDFYDGLLDAKAEAEYITYSWNYLHDSWKAALVGSSEDDTFDRKLTAHHNWFRNVNSRLPLFRGGNGHVFNNYYLDVADTAVNSRIGACLRIEANYFSNVQNPYVSAFSDDLGAGELRCNVLADGTAFAYADDVHELPSCTAMVPYQYSSVLNHPNDVPAVVMANAGVGKLDDPADF